MKPYRWEKLGKRKETGEREIVKEYLRRRRYNTAALLPRVPKPAARRPPPAAAPHGPGDDPCAQLELVNYDMGLHIASVFILLGVSLLGSLAPVLLRVCSASQRIATAIRLGTFFGVCAHSLNDLCGKPCIGCMPAPSASSCPQSHFGCLPLPPSPQGLAR